MRVRQEDESSDAKYYCELFPGVVAGAGAVVATGGGVTVAGFFAADVTDATTGFALAFSATGCVVAFDWVASRTVGTVAV